MRSILFIVVGLFFSSNAFGQKPQPADAYQIKQGLKSLNFLGKVLYVAAHPDDENTGMIAYFANRYGASTAYMSLTRGDGGQNLIGSELSEKLGVIRTQELLAARRIDGGRQFFSKAIDFGYSKKASETFDVWGKDRILADVVEAFRSFQPDIVINRFDHRTRGKTHGHHTAASILSEEAFHISADQDKFPDQLDELSTWQPKRLFFNTSWWFYGSKEAFKNADMSDFLKFDIGNYFPLRGLSTNEIAAVSRSQHKSQGFGNISDRGEEFEYTELINGEMPDLNNPFEGIDTSWSRIEGGQAIGEILNPLSEKINYEKPWLIVPDLIEALKLIKKLPDEHWRELKTEQIKSLISDCLGLYLEATALKPYANPGQEIDLDIEVTNRSQVDISLQEIKLIGNEPLQPKRKLSGNEQFIKTLSFQIPEDAAYSTPYWLENEPEMSVYDISENQSALPPVKEDQLNAIFTLQVNDELISFTKPIVHKYRDRVAGEVIDPFFILPKVASSFKNEVEIFKNKSTKKVEVKLKSFASNVDGKLSLKNTGDWKVTPEFHQVSFDQKEDEMSYSFEIKPGSADQVQPKIEFTTEDEKKISKKLVSIDYDHIPKQNLVLDHSAQWVNLPIKTLPKKVAYIPGVGDFLPNALENLDYNVSVIPIEKVSAEKLSAFDVIVLGIRAYNVHQALKFKNQILFDFVENGGKLITQYNKDRNMVTKDLAPYYIELSYDRVTEETADVQMLDKDDPVFNRPNEISSADFDNWVQEIGLYFPDDWSDKFKPLLAANDTGEETKKGILLVAEHGKGKFIYTGLSLFRQLPEGVPGAYRLLANLIAY